MDHTRFHPKHSLHTAEALGDKELCGRENSPSRRFSLTGINKEIFGQRTRGLTSRAYSKKES
jgi:hypothetical protein